VARTRVRVARAGRQTWLKYLGGIASVIVVLLLIFDRWAWRWLPLAVSKRPNLRGTWRAQLH
jgi:hypothetical protein